MDMDAAGFLNWGYQAGCDFLNSECNAYVAKHPNQQYYCTQADAASTSTVNTVCTFDGMARARCTNAQFADGCIMKVRGRRGVCGGVAVKGWGVRPTGVPSCAGEGVL